jgi:hypothetical protein
MVAPDAAVVDHRALGGFLGHGPDAAALQAQAAMGVTSELRFDIEEVLAATSTAIAVRGTWVGLAADGGGEVLLSMALAFGVTDGLVSSIDLYEPDDEAPLQRVT